VRGRATGFSLVEVIVALGLLAGILLAIAGLLVVGNREVRSGRHTSAALSVARAVLEEIETLGYHQTYELYGGAGNTTAHTAYSYDSSEPEASKWQARVVELLGGGPNVPHVEVHFESIAEPGAPQPNLVDSVGMRVEVRLVWTEGIRPRELELSTVKM
jgi:hypothetical protein